MRKDLISWHLKQDEGIKLKVYKCPKGRLSVGVGRNLEDRGITKLEADYLLNNDIDSIFNELSNKIDWFFKLDDIRQNVLIELAFNVGVKGALLFKKTLKFIENEQYLQASIELLDSKWHKDFIKYAPGHAIDSLRSSRLAKILEKGEY